MFLFCGIDFFLAGDCPGLVLVAQFVAITVSHTFLYFSTQRFLVHLYRKNTISFKHLMT